jgi:periplasmic protein TonB
MYTPSSIGALRRVPTRLVLVGGLHFIVIFALINGLHVRVGTPPPAAMRLSVIEESAPAPEKFLPPVVPVYSSTSVTPDPVIDPIITEVAPPPPSLDPLPPSVSTGEVTKVPEPVIVGAAVDPRHPLSQPPYPLASIRMSEEGALSLALLVGVDGRVREAKVAQSSGSERLDQAAVNEAKTHWHLRPATRGGVAFEQWLTLRVVFRLENR